MWDGLLQPPTAINLSSHNTTKRNASSHDSRQPPGKMICESARDRKIRSLVHLEHQHNVPTSAGDMSYPILSCPVLLPYLPSILRLVMYYSNLTAGLLAFICSERPQTDVARCVSDSELPTTGSDTCDFRFLGMIGQRSRMSSPKLSGGGGQAGWPGATSTDGPLGVPFLAIQTSSCLAAHAMQQ